MDAHLIDADGNPLPPLAQRDMFPPIRLIRPIDTERWNDQHKAMECLLCHGTNVGEPEDYHKPDCPVRRRDELLGR